MALSPRGVRARCSLLLAGSVLSTLGLTLLSSCGSPSMPEARARKTPAPCSVARAPSASAQVGGERGDVALDVHLQPAPAEAGGSVAVSLELRGASVESSSLRVPGALAA